MLDIVNKKKKKKKDKPSVLQELSHLLRKAEEATNDQRQPRGEGLREDLSACEETSNAH